MTNEQAIARLREYAELLDRAPVHGDMGLSMTHTNASDAMRDAAERLAVLSTAPNGIPSSAAVPASPK